MVRFNKQTDFNFPFAHPDLTTESATISKKKKFNGIFSTIFIGLLCAVLLALTFESSADKQITSSASAAMTLPFFETKSEMPKLASLSSPILQPQSAKPLSILPLLSTSQEEQNITSNVSQQKIVMNTSPSKTAQAKLVNEDFFTKTKTAEVPASYSSSSSIKTSTVKRNPKPKLVSNKMNASVPKNNNTFTSRKSNVITTPLQKVNTVKSSSSTLVLNKEITPDLLPLSYFEAKKEAATTGKLMFIKFGAPWCLPCRQMEETTFQDLRVLNYMERNYVKLDINVDDFDGLNLRSYFNVKRMPTILVFSSNGNFLGQYNRYLSADAFLKIMEEHDLPINRIKKVSQAVAPPTKIVATNKIPTIQFNQITLKKTKDGKAIKSIKSKAKNWRFTHVNFSTQHIQEGTLHLKVREILSGKTITELNLPLIKNNLRVADTTTTSTNYQLDLAHQKRKKKGGEYVLEIYHATGQTVNLIGKTTLLKDGAIRF